MRSPGSGSPVRPDTIGRRRRLAAISVAEFAAALGVRTQTVRRWESGHCSPPPQLVPRIAAALGCTAVDLLEVPVPRMTILQARYRLGWTTEVAAERASISSFTWNRIERGLGSPLPDRHDPANPPPVVRIAAALGISLEQALPERNRARPDA